MTEKSQKSSAKQSTQKPHYKKHKHGGTQKKASSSKPSVAAAPAPRRKGPVYQYLCTKCEQVVFKPRVKKADEEKGDPGRGLGKWKCRCGNKAVKRVKPSVVEQAAGKKAA